MELRLTLIPAADDSPPFGPEYQHELQQFWQTVQAPNLEVMSLVRVRGSVGGGGGYLGEFFLKYVGPGGLGGLGAVIGAWLHARYGRKVRLKIGEIEAEAQTVEEVEKLLKLAQEIQQPNKSKAAH